jgi:hypothetical protein
MKELLKTSIAVSFIATVCIVVMANFAGFSQTLPYSIVGTGQTISYDTISSIAMPV